MATHVHNGPVPDATTSDTRNFKHSGKAFGTELDTIRAKVSATRRSYDELATPTFKAAQAPGSKHSTEDLLEQYRELLRHQRRHAILVALKDELEGVKLSSGFTDVDIGTTTEGNLAETYPRLHQLETLTTSIKRFVHALELDVVRAREESKREKALLDRAKFMAAETNQSNPEIHRYALSAVRKELTDWLEQSLETCQESHSTPGIDVEVEVEGNDARWEAKIDSQYERYLQARRRLISGVACLRSPLPMQERKATVSVAESVGKSASLSHGRAQTGVVNVIESRLLPLMQQQNTSKAHLTSLDEQLQKETTTTINILDRLSDESQLLQAFPILAHSGRFEHAASAFGKKQDNAEEEVLDEVSKRLKSWLFAAKAADVASADTVETYLQQGDKAIQAASRSLDALRLIKNTGP
ncbi:hypothetical protein PV04_10357 [Phialophora macrospora]|uniref:Uncharacterized protein n=1 Tax=Phialophora macrospora TaxID=1851006 RepID=A0A0D2CAY6_9EURO|nr:hypothetical protein PV04_10357 [Phialophora macrospora]